MDESDTPFQASGGNDKCHICTCCFGWILLPFAMYFAGWNEYRSVCRAKAVYAAEENYHEVSCDVPGDYEAGDLVFVSCDVDSSTLHDFGAADFPGVEIPGMHTFGTSVQMTTEMMECIQDCARTGRVCEPSDDPGAHNGQMCTNACVEWSYRLEWTSEVPNEYAPAPSPFKNQTAASKSCGRAENPYKPNTELKLGTTYAYAPDGSVGLKGGKWHLEKWQMESFPINVSVETMGGDFSEFTQDSVQPPVKLSPTNSYQDGSFIASCDDTAGCVRVKFMKASPSHVTMLGKAAATEGLLDEDGWIAPSDWLCEGWDINRVCPAGTGGEIMVDAVKGATTACPEEQTPDQMFDDMESGNFYMSVFYRILSWLLLFGAIQCILAPIKACVSMVTRFSDQITECIPGVGWVIDTLTDVVDALVSCVLAMISCFCASACFLVIAGVMWLVMRPLLGGAMLVISMCCLGCAAGAVGYSKQPKGHK